MDKNSILRLSICNVVLLILTSLTQVVSGQAIQSLNEKVISMYDDVTIDIYAGIHKKTNGNYGLGFVIGIANNLDINITCSIRIYWNFTDNINVQFDNDSLNLSAHSPEILIGDIDWLHFPFPILKLQVIVTINEISKTVSRRGLEIGPVVFFFDEGK